jgi:hypothetical protein
MRDGVHSRQMNAPRPRSSHWHGRRVSSADIGPRPIKAARGDVTASTGVGKPCTDQRPPQGAIVSPASGSATRQHPLMICAALDHASAAKVLPTSQDPLQDKHSLTPMTLPCTPFLMRP